MPSQLFDVGSPDVVYIVDLSSYLLRAYHAVAPLSSPEGEPTHAVHGTVTMLERLFRERKPVQLAIAMDSGRDTFRKELYEDYKANRPPAPDDLRVQIQRAEEIVRAWGLPVLKQTGVEADDLIASLVRRCTTTDRRVVIVSADKDLMQLVGRDVLMWDTLRNKVFGVSEVEERFKVSPKQLGDLLALMGDSSDNVPGVPSVGPKTAATLLQDHENLDGIFAALDGIKRKKLQATLREHEAQARLSRKLVALKEDCPVEHAPESLVFHFPHEFRAKGIKRGDPERLEAIYEELGFVRQLAALRKAMAGEDTSVIEGGASVVEMKQRAPQELPAAEVLTQESEIEQLKCDLSKGTWALELYTLRPDEHRGPLLGVGFSNGQRSVYVPFSHRYVGAPQPLPRERQARLLARLGEAEQPWVVHNLKRTLVLLQSHFKGLAIGEAFDTMLASYLIDPERNHGVEALGATFGVEVPDYDAITKEKRKKRTWDEVDVEVTASLSRSRTGALLAAAKGQAARLTEVGQWSLLKDVELPLSRELAELELRGVLVDRDELEKLGRECAAQLVGLHEKAHAAAGKQFNVNSPRQLEEILFDELGLKPIKRTKTSRSTDAQTLEALAEQHPLPELILRIRQISKLVGTYIEALPQLMDPKTGRIHSSWEQAVAATGRLSSTDPNLQNIPIRNDLGRRIRDAFVAPPGHQLVSADYSQIELRVLAHLSQDERLVEAFQNGQDVHLRTAMEIFDLAPDEVTREHRARAKAVNFGVIYGQGENALAQSLGIERTEAARFIAAYFRRYDGVRSFMDQTLQKARAGEAVRSLLGRRRIVPDIKSGNRARRLAAERIAMNMPIQGSAADILKLAMLALSTPPTPGTKMVLTVHDELVFEVPSDEVDEAKARIKQAMESAALLSVPLTVDVGSGTNWNQAH